MNKTQFNDGLISCISYHTYELSKLLPDNEELMDAYYDYDYECSLENCDWEQATVDGFWLSDHGLFIPAIAPDRDEEEFLSEYLQREHNIDDKNPDYEYLDKGEWFNETTKETYTDFKDHEQMCDDLSIEPEMREVFEHWIVSPYLARWLKKQGEKVIDIIGLENVWCRTTTGQMCYMDFHLPEE